MKKTIISLAVLLATSSANAAVIYQAEDGSFVDLYARLGFNINNKNGGGDEDTYGKFDGRIGFDARQAINDKFAVIGKTQYQVNAAEYSNNLNNVKCDGTDQITDGNNEGVDVCSKWSANSDFTARYVWAGVDLAEYGKITGGRVTSGLINFTDIGDIFASSDIAVARQANKVDPTATQVFRQDGTLQYANAWGGLSFTTAYILGNSTSNLDYGYNATLSYAIELGEGSKLLPIVAYQNTKSDEQDGNDEYSFWGVGARYYVNDFVFGALYSEDEVSNYNDTGDNSTDVEWEVTAIYNINEKWVAKMGYRDLENTGGDELRLQDTTLELQYKLTPRSSIFTDYVSRNGENGTNNTTFGGTYADQDFFHVGLRYEL